MQGSSSCKLMHFSFVAILPYVDLQFFCNTYKSVLLSWLLHAILGQNEGVLWLKFNHVC